MQFIIVISMLMVNLTVEFNMWNFEDKVKTNDIEEICNLLKAYKGKWVAMVDRSSGAIEYDGTTCANPEVNGNKADAAWKQVPMYKPSLWTRFIWWLKDKFGIV